MRRAVALVACVAASAGAQESLPSLSPARVTGQVVSGTIGLPVGYVVGGLTTRQIARWFGASDDAASRAGYAGAYVGAALGTAGGVSLVGARGPGAGSFPAAIGGAVVGGAGSVLLVRALHRSGDAPPKPCKLGCVVASAAIVMLPSIGATVAYNATR